MDDLTRHFAQLTELQRTLGMTDPLSLSSLASVSDALRIHDHQAWLLGTVNYRDDLLRLVADFRPSLEGISAVENSSAILSQLRQAHLGLATTLSEQVADLSAEMLIARASTQWVSDAARLARVSTELPSAEMLLGIHSAGIIASTLATERLIAGIRWQDFDPLTGVVAEMLAQPFGRLADAYTPFVDGLRSGPHAMLALPPIVTGLPPVEMFTAANVFHSFVPADHDRSEDEEGLRAEITKEVEDELEGMLGVLHADLPEMWRGARAALASRGPDWRRHAMTSTRELATHVLHTLAPDDEVRSWTSDPKDYHPQDQVKGRPTRSARLRYVCHPVSSGAFTVFVEKDVAAALAAFEFLQRLHDSSIGLTDAQVEALVLRMGSLLRFLIDIRRIR